MFPSILESRVVSALQYMFVGDSLAMPVHWFYNPQDIIQAFPPKGIEGFEDAPSYHPSSIMNLHSTSEGGRSNIGRNKKPQIVGEVILKGRQSFWGQPNEHYHRGMKAGENTLNLQVARVLLRTLTKTKGNYDQSLILDSYIDYMTADPPAYNDTYAESYHRGFFANLATGLPKNKCGAVTHDTPSIGGLVSIGPLALTLILKELSTSKEISSEKIKAKCRDHLFLTHPDKSLALISDEYVELIIRLLFRGNEVSAKDIVGEYAQRSFRSKPLDRYLKLDNTKVVGGLFSPACYITDSWPALLYFATKYAESPYEGLLANTNVGGDNCHRGAVLGFIFGLISGEESPLYNKLIEASSIQKEIQAWLTSISINNCM